MKRRQLTVSWWDRFLLGVAPSYGLRRLRARASAFAFEASSGGRRSDSWHRSSSDANAANGMALPSLRELSRDLRRNNGWARRGIQAIASNTVGWGIAAKAKGVDAGLGKKAIDAWQAWADSPLCDFDGRMPFAGLQRLVMETIVESGEALVIRQPAGADDDLAIPLRVQVLEPDYLDTTKIGRDDAGPIIQGIEFDRSGRRVAYWLHTAHPGGALMSGLRFESRRVPAKDVLHIYRVERPGQARGVPWLASAISKLNDFDDYEDAQLMQQKVAACFAAFVQDFDGAGTAIGQQDAQDPEVESLEPGHISYLPPGKTVAFGSPPAVTDTTFTVRNLRRIAASLGVTYEDLTGDLSMINFSSARIGRLAHYANVHDWRWNMLIPQFCDGVWRWAMELAAGLEGWAEVPAADWAPPPMPMLEPDKEGLAYQRLVRSGAMTLYQMIRERGEDPAAHLAEIAAGNAQLDELGIVLDSDARKTNASGGVQGGAGQAAPAAAEEEPEEEEEPVPPGANGANGKAPSNGAHP